VTKPNHALNHIVARYLAVDLGSRCPRPAMSNPRAACPVEGFVQPS